MKHLRILAKQLFRRGETAFDEVTETPTEAGISPGRAKLWPKNSCFFLGGGLISLPITFYNQLSYRNYMSIYMTVFFGRNRTMQTVRWVLSATSYHTAITMAVEHGPFIDD